MIFYIVTNISGFFFICVDFSTGSLNSTSTGTAIKNDMFVHYGEMVPGNNDKKQALGLDKKKHINSSLPRDDSFTFEFTIAYEFYLSVSFLFF